MQRNKSKVKDWQETHEGRCGFFQGLATSEEDAMVRSRRRIGFLITSLREMIWEGKTEQELMAFLDRIEVKHA